MGRYHPDLDDWAEGAPKEGSQNGEKGSYSTSEKYCAVGVLETVTVGTLLALSRRPYFRTLGTKCNPLTVTQQNILIGGSLSLPFFFIAFQRAYYDTLISYRNIDRGEYGANGKNLGDLVDFSVFRLFGSTKIETVGSDNADADEK